MKGYDWGQEKHAQWAKKEINKLEAKGPEDIKTAIDTPESKQQISQLEEQTAELYESDPEVQAAEDALYADTGRTVFVQKDWDTFRQQMARLAGAIPDLDVGRDIDKRIEDLQQRGFSDNAMKAAAALDAGNLEAAGTLMQQAWGFMPDGTTARYMKTTDPETGKPIFVSWRIDEETGKPVGNPTPITSSMLRDYAFTVTEDPAKFQELSMKQKELVLEGRRVKAAETTAEAAKTRAEAEMVYSEAYAAGGGGRRGSDQGWNSASRQRLVSNINTRLTSLKNNLISAMDKAATPAAANQAEAQLAWYNENENKIINDANLIGEYWQDLDGAQSMGVALEAARMGMPVYYDEQGPYVVYPNGEEKSIDVFAQDLQTPLPGTR
jgi:hypothetical protein